MFGNHGLRGLPEEGAHEKSPKCLGGNLGDFGDFAKVSGGKSPPFPSNLPPVPTADRRKSPYH
ncbi:hypothetical protein E4K43_08595 [Neisseria meningitidis]|nr:hypothetical protein [Neisseria meningitidis]